MRNFTDVVKAVSVLSFFVFSLASCNSGTNSSNGSNTVVFSSDSSAMLPIAYVNVDSLLNNYNYAKEVNSMLMSKAESSRASLNQKRTRFQSEQREYQRKMENNAFLDQSRYEQETKRLQGLAADLEQTAARLDEELYKEQLKVNNQLADSVKLAIELFNNKANYEIILTNTGFDNILYAKDKYDVTKQVLEVLNGRTKAVK